MEEKIKIQLHSNRKISCQIPRLNGMAHGLSIVWYRNGKLWYKFPYKNDIQCGARIIFYY